MIPAPNNFVSVRSLTGQDLKWVKQLATLATTSALAKKPRKLKSSKLNMKITFFLIMKGWFDETFRYYSFFPPGSLYTVCPRMSDPILYSKLLLLGPTVGLLILYIARVVYCTYF